MTARGLQDRSATPFAPAVIGTLTGPPTVSTVLPPSIGQTMTLHDWSSAGSLEILRAGWALAFGAGGGSADQAANYGNGGDVFYGWLWLPTGIHAVTIGAAGAAGFDGGSTRLGALLAVPGAPRATSPSVRYGAGRGLLGANIYDGRPVDITGTPISYAGAFGSTLTTYGSSYSGGAAAGRLQLAIPAV